MIKRKIFLSLALLLIAACDTSSENKWDDMKWDEGQWGWYDKHSGVIRNKA